MSVCLMVTLQVDPDRVPEVTEGFKLRHAQSLRLGALSHELWQLTEPGADAGLWMGTMTFRDLEHLAQFGAAQEADPEAAATIGRLAGPGGPIAILGQRVAVLRG